VFWRKKEPEDFIEKKQYQKAIGLFKEKLKDQPQNTALLMNLADTLLLDQQVDLAVREYKKVASIQTDQGFVLKAIAVYKKILKLQPDNTEVEHLLSNLSERMALTTESGPAKEKTSKQQPASTTPVEIETELFKGLTRDEFKQVVSKLKLRHFDQNSIIVKEGDPGDSMFVVVRGEVRVVTHTDDNKEVFLANLGEGEFFGEIALLTGKPRTATIITNSNSELLELTKADYEKIVAKFPNVTKVVEEFHLQRTYKTVEAMIQARQEKSSS
jgi:cAMP-dependent protein kinase regulator